MSPFSHRGDQGRLSLAELGPVLQEVLNSVASVPVEQFAEQIMTRYFAAEQVMPSQVQGLTGAGQVCSDLLPPYAGLGPGELIPDAYYALQDLVAEAMQLLQNAGLVMERSYRVHQGHEELEMTGMVTTRRGGRALAASAVGQVLSQVYPAPPPPAT
jgi:hypothetical protein